MARRRLADIMPVGAGDPGISYDRTGLSGGNDPSLGGVTPAPPGGGGGVEIPGANVTPTPGDAEPGGAGMTTDALSNQDLASAVDGEPGEEIYQQMTAALADPNTPPEVKQQIESMIALEARRSLLGAANQ